MPTGASPRRPTEPVSSVEPPIRTAADRRCQSGFGTASEDCSDPHEFRLLAEPPADPGIRQRIQALVSEQNTKLATALGDGIADGSVRPSLNATQAATALWAMMNGLLAQHIAATNNPTSDTDGLVATALDILRYGIEQS
ncbi:TetR family transcriptional regulator C-terminal domain-containing protein [Nocardia tengchongensis]|uniref:TetR family transcriptional regulator C-terminal domain-containing protein n=1 Tax=Nocardia tengchongensis TaxID=2055889 RepID=UPI003619648B